MMYAECFSIGIVAWVFHAVLFEQGMVFGWWGDFVHGIKTDLIAKPLGKCGVCFAGQVGFWWYMIAYRDSWILGQHIVFTCQVLFAFLLIQDFKGWLSKQING